MELRHIENEDLTKYLPHRGRNLLLDSVDKSETPKGPQAEITLAIGQPDRLKRDIFLEKDVEQNAIYSPYMFAEFLALGSIVLTDLPPDTMAYFSTISNFVCEHSVSASGPLHGVTVRNKDRGLFRRFTGRILDPKGGVSAQTDIMAFAFNPKTDAERQEKKIAEKPVPKETRPVTKELFSWKPEAMVFVDEVSHLNLDDPTALLRYTYPQDHPFVEGHFPGNPIMMGITQWIGCADAVTWLTYELAQAKSALLAGKENWIVGANVEMVKPDGTVACEIKDIKLKFQSAETGKIPFPQLLGTKRIGFRDLVRPNETLFYRILQYQIQN